MDRVQVMEDVYDLVAYRVPRLVHLQSQVACFGEVFDLRETIRSHMHSFLLEWCNIVQYLYVSWTGMLMHGSHDAGVVERMRNAFCGRLTMGGRELPVMNHHSDHTWCEYIKKCLFSFGNHETIFYHFDFHPEHLDLLMDRVGLILNESYYLPEFVRNSSGAVYRLFSVQGDVLMERSAELHWASYDTEDSDKDDSPEPMRSTNDCDSDL